MAWNPCLPGAKLQVNVSGGLQRITHHKERYQRGLRKVKHSGWMFHVGPHDPFNGADACFQIGQILFWPKRGVGLIPPVFSLLSSFKRGEGHSSGAAWSQSDKEQA
jgi:hypothetical protein